jgi:hypothetical protein
MHRLIPSSDLLPVLGKSVLGQIFYGPIYTSMFFLSQLIPVSEKEGFLASFADAFRNLLLPKIRRDFFGVWEVGVWFWITVDLISFKFIPLNLIPLYERRARPERRRRGGLTSSALARPDLSNPPPFCARLAGSSTSAPSCGRCSSA